MSRRPQPELNDKSAPPPEFFTLFRGDSRRLDQLLREYSSPEHPLLTATVTSPPYWNLKNYGHVDQIGFGQSHEDYLIECRAIFRAVARHTRDEGCMWLVADTLMDRISQPTRLHPLPFQLAEQAEEAGWTLKDTMIWKKDKTLPWSGRGRLRNTFEYVLFLVKSETFKYHIDRLRDPVQLEEWWVRYPERYNPQGKVPTNLWEVPIPVQGSWANTSIQHACPLPPDLVERMLLLSTDPGDVVFDPFAGSGVVVAEAERLGRRGLGVDLVDRHVRAYHQVVRPEILQRRGRDELVERMDRGAKLKELILKLRAMKFPRVLLRELAKNYPHIRRPLLAVAQVGSELTLEPFNGKLIECSITVVQDASLEERDETQRLLKEMTMKKPASKFGVTGEVRVISPGELTESVSVREDWYLYPDGRTWWFECGVACSEMTWIAKRCEQDRTPPIFGNVPLQERPRTGSGPPAE